jgi:hypothetical protein
MPLEAILGSRPSRKRQAGGSCVEISVAGLPSIVLARYKFGLIAPSFIARDCGATGHHGAGCVLH